MYVHFLFRILLTSILKKYTLVIRFKNGNIFVKSQLSHTLEQQLNSTLEINLNFMRYEQSKSTLRFAKPIKQALYRVREEQTKSTLDTNLNLMSF